MSDIVNPPLNVESLMERVREEVRKRNPERYGRPDIEASPVGPDVDFDHLERMLEARASGHRLPRNVMLTQLDELSARLHAAKSNQPAAAVSLRQLLALQDSEFVEAAYQSLLGRCADAEGMKCYLNMLQAGATQIEVLGRIASSEEARARGATIPGLSSSFFLDRVLRWPIVGRFLAVLLAIWNLPLAERQQRSLNGQTIRRLKEGEAAAHSDLLSITESLLELQRGVNEISLAFDSCAAESEAESVRAVVLQLTRAVRSKQDQYARKAALESVEASVGRLAKQIESLTDKKTVSAAIESLEAKLNNHAHGVEKRVIDSVEGAVKPLRADFDAIAARTADQDSRESALNERVQRLEARLEEAQDAQRRDLRRLQDLLGSIDERASHKETFDQLKGELRTDLSDLKASLVSNLEWKAQVQKITAAQESIRSRLDEVATRQELIELSQVVEDMVEQRALASDVGEIGNSLLLLEHAIRDLRSSKADSLHVLTLIDQYSLRLNEGLHEINCDVADIIRTKPGFGDLDALRVQLNSDVSFLMEGCREPTAKSTV